MTDNLNNDRHFDDAKKVVFNDSPPYKHTDHDFSDLIHQVEKETIHQREQEMDKYWSTHKLGPADLPTLIIGHQDNLPSIFLAAGALGGAAGSWASSELSFLSKQKDFLARIPNAPHLGTTEDLSLGRRLFSPDTHISKYGNFWERNTEFSSKHSLSFARGPLGPMLERASNSWLGRTLSGTGRGLVVTAGILAVGYACEQVGNMMAHNPQEK